MEIRWSLPAAQDLERICERIERDNPEAARRVARTVYEGCSLLKDFQIVDAQALAWRGDGSWRLRHCPTLRFVRLRRKGLKSRGFSTERRIGHNWLAALLRFFLARSLLLHKNREDFPASSVISTNPLGQRRTVILGGILNLRETPPK